MRHIPCEHTVHWILCFDSLRCGGKLLIDYYLSWVQTTGRYLGSDVMWKCCSLLIINLILLSWVAITMTPWHYTLHPEKHYRSGSASPASSLSSSQFYTLYYNPIFFCCFRKSILISWLFLDDMRLTDYPCLKLRIDLFVCYRLWEYFSADSGWEHFSIFTLKKNIFTGILNYLNSVLIPQIDW